MQLKCQNSGTERPLESLVFSKACKYIQTLHYDLVSQESPKTRGAG
jgi:hypothetical protein